MNKIAYILSKYHNYNVKAKIIKFRLVKTNKKWANYKKLFKTWLNQIKRIKIDCTIHQFIKIVNINKQLYN